MQAVYVGSTKVGIACSATGTHTVCVLFISGIDRCKGAREAAQHLRLYRISSHITIVEQVHLSQASMSASSGRRC
jgi:hypothetical protein